MNRLPLNPKFVFFLFGIFVMFFTANSHGQNSSVTIRTNQWSFKTIGSDAARGTFAISNGTFRIDGGGSSDGIHFVFLPLKNNGQIIARLAEFLKNDSVKSGVMIRQALAEDSPFASMSVTTENILAFERRLDPAGKIISTIETNAAAPRWLRFVREGNAFSGFFSSDGTNWVQISADTIEMGTDVFAGLAIAGEGETVFDNVQITSAHLANPSENSSFVVPTNILIKAEIASFGSAPDRIEFFADAKKIGETTNTPYAMEWTNALAGGRSLIAMIIDGSGAEFFTEPAICEIKLPRASAKFIGIDETTRGNWKEKYGAEGFYIVKHATNYPAYAEVSSSRHQSILVNYSSEPDALKFTNGNGGLIAQWFTYTNMTANILLLDGRPHQVALYFHDWDSNLRVQQVEVIDATTRAVLDTRRVASIHSAKYFTWEVRGAVAFKITAIAGNAVLGGIFFDPSPLQSVEQSK